MKGAVRLRIHSKDTTNASVMSQIIPENPSDFTGTSTSVYASTIVRWRPERYPQHGENDCIDIQDKSNNKICSTKGASSLAHQSLMGILPRFDTVFEDIPTRNLAVSWSPWCF